MKNYEYHRIGELAKQLEKAEVERSIIYQIMEGGMDILRKTSPEKKADWMREAMLQMDKLLNLETRKAVREAYACRLLLLQRWAYQISFTDLSRTGTGLQDPFHGPFQRWQAPMHLQPQVEGIKISFGICAICC